MSLNSLQAPAHSPHFCTELFTKLGADDKAALNALFSVHTDSIPQCQKLINCSRFACQLIVDDPMRLYELFDLWSPYRALVEKSYKRILNNGLRSIDDLSEFNRALRQWRKRAMLRILWRDINRLCALDDTTHELSWLAEICLQAALNFHTAVLQQHHGNPRNKSGEIQPFYVLGMGKLGAWELNLSSDIDLIFCYPDAGITDGALVIDNYEFFNRLGKALTASLDQRTADGFVFRVDMRLRPWGQSGALVSSFAALEEYYHNHGRDWERYAMIKARIVAGTEGEDRRDELMALLRQFCYRRYVDFSVVEALRTLKSQIRQEVRKRRLDNDVKRGSGGIREIEFIAQAFQLIRGGRDTELQDARLQVILPLLAQLNCIPQSSADALIKAYIFLRNTEHALQAFNDEQSHVLPKEQLEQEALIQALGFITWQDFLSELQGQRLLVSTEFEATIGDDSKSITTAASSSTAQALWQQASFRDRPAQEQAPDPLFEFAHSPLLAKLGATGRERLDQFMPLLLTELEHTLEPQQRDLSLQRLLPLLRNIVRRSAYLMLLIENPAALKQLVRLATMSEQIAEQLAKYPALLDELLDTSSLYAPLDKAALQAELRRSMLRVDEDDVEQQMESLRYFRLSHALRIVACELAETLPLMKVSDQLTFLAEVILHYVLHLAWRELTRQHGYPDGLQSREPSFLIVGYGKLGSLEMNHGSDLDLVFVYDASINGMTDGARAIENQTFYIRLGQKLIHLLNTNTSSGRLYEVDMRLRPSGNSGLLSTSFTAFENYQRNAAWTWEHQALIKARPVAGDATIAQRVNALRTEILCRQRDLNSLKRDIIDMRQKMREQLGSKPAQTRSFHLKQDAGGIVDIEFMVQYAVLAWSHAEPALATYTDNIRILEALAHTDTLSTQEVAQLIAAYKALRVVLHRLTIEQKPPVVDEEDLKTERDSVTRIWQRLFSES